MFNYFADDNFTALETAIARLLSKMEKQEPGSEEYSKAADDLVKLLKLKNDALKLDNEAEKIRNEEVINNHRMNTEEHKIRYDHSLEEEKLRFDKERARSWKPSTDALVSAAASVLGIVLVLNYEKMGVVTSKAFGFIGKTK